MKRQIMKSFSALCVSAMALFAASSLVVSCYDDSKLWDEVENLDSRVKAIEELKSNLETLTARVDALYTLKFQVTTDNALQYSFDGGTTWVSTGIVLAEDCTCPEVSLVDNGSSVTITVGEESFTIEKPEVVKFEILSGKQFFEYGQTKEVILAAKGIKSVFVAKSPKGWSVDVDGTDALVITAPAETAAAAAQKGVVEVWGATAEGAIMVGTLGVIVSDAPSAISMVGDDTVVFSINEDPEYGTPYTIFYGISKAENFETDAQDVVEKVLAQSEAMYELNSNWDGEASVEVKIAELLGEEPVAGNSYVIWSVTPTMVRQGWAWTYEIAVSDFVKYYYTPTEVVIESVSSWNDIELTVDVIGADEYLAGWIAVDDYFDPEYFDIYEYLTATPGGMWGPAGMFSYYTEKWEGSIKDFCSPDYRNEVSPDTEYFVFVLPMDPFKSAEDYTAADVTTKVIKTDALQPGGTATATIDLTADNAVSPTALRPVVKTDAAITYYEWLNAEKMTLYQDDELLIDYILNESYYVMMRDEAEFQAPYTNAEPETEYTLVLVLVDKDGKYSLQKEVVKSAALPLSDEISVTFDADNCVVTGDAVTLKVVLDGEFETVVFWKSQPNDYYTPTASEFEAKVCSTDHWWEYTYVKVSDLVDGTYTFEVEPETDYTFFVMGCTADGKYSYADDFSCSPVLEIGAVKTEGFAVAPTFTYHAPEYIEPWSADYGYYYDASEWGIYYYYDGSYTVNPNGIAYVMAYVVDANDTDYGYDWKTLTAEDKVKKMLLDFYYNEATEEDTFNKNLSECQWSEEGEEYTSEVSPVAVLLWQDADGAYCLMEVPFADQIAPLRADMHQQKADELVNNKQWTFKWADMFDVSSALDFGVSQPGYFGITYDALEIYGEENFPEELHGYYMWYNGWSPYEIKAIDATSGIVYVSTVDHFGDVQTAQIATYADHVSTTMTFTSEMLYIDGVEMTVASETIPVYIEMGGGMGL